MTTPVRPEPGPELVEGPVSKGRRSFDILAVLALAAASPFVHAQCALSSAATPEPPWVQAASEPAASPWLHANGVASATGVPLERAREQARSAALAELGQQVQADVRSRINTELEKVTAAGRTRTSETFRAVSEVLSRLQLRGVVVINEWADVPGCRLWMRVRVSAEEAERARRTATSDAAAAGVTERLAVARDGALAAAQRQAALAEAGELARLADPALTPGFSRDAFELQRAELGGALGAARQREDQFKEAMLRHVQAYGRVSAAGAAAAGERRGAQREALAALEQALTLAPAGVPGYTLPFAPTERLATLFADLGAACVGRQWFERRALAVPAALRDGSGGVGATPAASTAAGTCDAPRLARERRTLALAGRTLQLECSLTLAGTRGAWPKACTALQTALIADGALVHAGAGRADLVASVHAAGQIEERRDAHSGKSGWRFRGKIATQVRGTGGLDLADEYEGLTGFNPVSAAMAGDLLALAVVQRLDKALSALWDK